MMNPKYISTAAGIGFVLSFLIGIFSGIGFGHIIFRAFICAVLFAGLAVGILFLNQKFLSDGQADVVSDASGEKAPRMGGVVDITINADRLPEEDQGPQFSVDQIRASLRDQGPGQPRTLSRSTATAATVLPGAVSEPPAAAAQSVLGSSGAKQTAAPQTEPENVSSAEFTPMSLAQVASAPAVAERSEKTAVASADAPVATEATQGASAGLEELPDIGVFGGDDADSDAEDSEEVAEEDDFSEDDIPRPRTSAGGIPATEQSASVMAQAIRTVLAKDR